MNNDINNFIASTSKISWSPLVEEGIDTTGIHVKPLRHDEHTGRAPSILLKFEPGARYPYHNHPGGEEIMVLSGSCEIEGATLHEGDYLYTPPNFKHAVTTKEGCVLFLMIPEEVEILER